MRVVKRLAAAPGWHVVFADPTREPPVRFVPVAAWAVIEAGAGTPRGPEVVPIAEGDDAPVLPGTAGYLGAAAPGESPDTWVERARALLGGG